MSWIRYPVPAHTPAGQQSVSRVVSALAPPSGITGSAALSVAQPSITASGELIFTGSAALSVTQPSIAASGAAGFDGSAALTVTQPTITGTGTLEFTGTAALVVGQPVIAGTGTISGAPAPTPPPALVMAGTTASVRRGAVVTDQNPLSMPVVISASPLSGISGSAALDVTQPAIAASGTETFSGTAALLVTQPTIAASGAQVFTGTGALSVTQPGVAASGVEIFIGTAALSVTAPAIAGAGLNFSPITGTAALEVTIPLVEGVAEQIGLASTVTGGGGGRRRFVLDRLAEPKKPKRAQKQPREPLPEFHLGDATPNVRSPVIVARGAVVNPPPVYGWLAELSIYTPPVAGRGYVESFQETHDRLLMERMLALTVAMIEDE